MSKLAHSHQPTMNLIEQADDGPDEGDVAHHDYRRPPGECPFCDAYPNEGPAHTPSERCQSGKYPHCTCNVCF